MYYSAKENEFYGQQKEGSVFIPDADAFALMSQKQNGGTIIPDANGLPVYVAKQVYIPTPSEQIATLQNQIDSIEIQTKMNRFVREAMILISQQQAAALGMTEPQLYAANIGYKKVKDIDTQIIAIREQITALGG